MEVIKVNAINELKVKVVVINGEIWTWEPMGSLVISLSQKTEANKTQAMVNKLQLGN